MEAAKKVKVVLADPPRVDNLRYSSYLPNMGILYLSAYIKKVFDNIEVHYLESFLTLREHIDKIKNIQPDIYGISFASFLKEKSFITVKAVKQECKNLLVVTGGAHPTVFPEECLEAGADVCVMGEGEETLAELLAAIIAGKKDYSAIAGIAYKKNGEGVKIANKRNFIHDLDTIPFPDWDLCQEKKYTGPIISKARPHWICVISRGCPFNCNFCANPVWKYNKPWLRLRSPENIAEEIQLLYKRGYREVTLRCDEFNSNLNWAKNVCRAIKSLGLQDMYFDTLLRAAPIDNELCSLLKDINCWSVNLGIESANGRVLKGIRKFISINKITRCCELLRKYKIRTFGFFMMFNVWEEDGKPQFETIDEVYNTLNFSISLLKRKMLANISWGFVSPIPGSELFNTCQKYKLIPENAYLVSKYDKTAILIPNVTEKEKRKLRRFGYKLKIKYGLKNDFFNLNFKDFRYIARKVLNLVR